MSSLFERRLQQLSASRAAGLLTGIQRGIEKESLRILASGHLAQTPHPRALGSALTNPYITTDYSEALLELITPVSRDIEATLGQLEDIHRYVYAQLGDELLWTASMPCMLGADDAIPVARYGSSNVARMKTVYRYGLGHRYGRLMQTIAGIHYNFSMPAAFWPLAQQADGARAAPGDYITQRYLGLIRNFRRHSWLLIYLFGASPTVCSSFLRDHSGHSLVPFDPGANSWYAPHGTALRMGDLGYSSNAQKHLAVCYNTLDSYIDTLRQAITRPYPDYVALGLGSSGQEKQLNTGLLQIENEFYSPVRPKRVARSGETPLGALRRDGIEYVEVRCIDVNPAYPMGIDAAQIRFIDAFLLYCLLADSPDCDERERALIAENLQRVVNRGRAPGLQLATRTGAVAMTELAAELLAATAACTAALDEAHGGSAYADAQQQQQEKIAAPEATPSAQILARMTSESVPFFRLAMNASEHWAGYFRSTPLAADKQQHFQETAARSLVKQQALEALDAPDFAHYLKDYYQQYDAL